MLPDKFTESLRDILTTDEAAELADAIEGTEPSASVRFNPFKIGEKPSGRQIPWSRYGFWLDERPQFTLDPMFHAGAYYVQEPSSMFVEHIYRSAVGEQDNVRLLDLCASPGGKTTLYSTVAGLDGLVVANEVIRQRAMTLADNVRKWGLGNVVVTNNDPAHFAGFRNWFDVIAVDAPCSGEGMFRKDPKAREEWSPDLVKLCAARQRRILSDIWDALKPGGILIYSTCTYNRQENEANIEWLCTEFDCEGVPLDTPTEWNIRRGAVRTPDGGDIPTFRFYPHLVEGEGFFAAVVRKGGQGARAATPKARCNALIDIPRNSVKELSAWVGQPEFMVFAQAADNVYAYYDSTFADTKTVAGCLSVVASGIQMGQVFKGSLRPEHPLAMFHDLDRTNIPTAELPLDAALDYLRKQNSDAQYFSEGMNLVTFEGFPLGWAKRIGARVNNMYPKELRIMHL